MSVDHPSPEQQLAQQQLLNILPYVLGFGVIGMIPISYLFIAPVFSDDIGVQIIVTIGIVIANGIVDVVFLKIMTENLKNENLKNENWVSSEGVESGPNVAGDWYVAYASKNGEAPNVVGIYEENYGVDIGDGAIPIEFYIRKWGVPEGYGATDFEKQFEQSSQVSENEEGYTPGDSILE